jgi:hypothetical protein
MYDNYYLALLIVLLVFVPLVAPLMVSQKERTEES